MKIMQDCTFLWRHGKNCCNLTWNFWFIHHIQKALILWISIYFSFYKILLMEKNFHYLEDSTWNSSLLKKINCFRNIKLWSCLKNGRRQWNKRTNTLFRKVLGENEKKMCLLSKSWKKKNTFWPTQYLIILKGNTFVWSLVLQVHGIVLKRIFSLLHTDQDLGSCLHDARNDSLPTFFEFTKSYFLLDWIYKIFAPCSLLDKSTYTQTCWAKKKTEVLLFCVSTVS